MNTPFNRGFLFGVIYYGAAFFVALTVYLIFGWDYKHAPGFHHLIAFSALAGGVIMTARAFIRLIINKHEQESQGFLFISLPVILFVILYIRASG